LQKGRPPHREGGPLTDDFLIGLKECELAAEEKFDLYASNGHQARARMKTVCILGPAVGGTRGWVINENKSWGGRREAGVANEIGAKKERPTDELACGGKKALRLR